MERPLAASLAQQNPLIVRQPRPVIHPLVALAAFLEVLVVRPLAALEASLEEQVAHPLVA